MSLIQSVEKMLSSIMKVQESIYEKYISESVVSLNTVNLDEFSLHEHNAKVIFDQVHLKILYVSSNFEDISGYSAAELDDYNLITLMRHVDLEHFMYPYNMAAWSKEVYEKNKTLKNLKVYTCGLKIKSFKTNKILRLLIRYSPIEVFENDVVKLAAITVDDVTHLIKSDNYWLRMKSGENNEFTNHFTSKEKKNVPKDIISKREKEILRLISEGMESKEIAETLFISLNTVDNHRRNMILQTGARDTTALVQLCKMMHII
jgi:DNA-binding CsgD family transcriptional regulator